MRIGNLGSALMDGRLGTIFARTRHEVVFSYGRSNDDLKRLARDAQGNARVTYSLPMDAGSAKLMIGSTTSGAEELAKKVPGPECQRRSCQADP